MTVGHYLRTMKLFLISGYAERSVSTERFVAVIAAETASDALRLAMDEPCRGCSRDADVREIGYASAGTPLSIITVGR